MWVVSPGTSFSDYSFNLFACMNCHFFCTCFTFHFTTPNEFTLALSLTNLKSLKLGDYGKIEIREYYTFVPYSRVSNICVSELNYKKYACKFEAAVTKSQNCCNGFGWVHSRGISKL